MGLWSVVVRDCLGEFGDVRRRSYFFGGGRIVMQMFVNGFSPFLSPEVLRFHSVFLNLGDWYKGNFASSLVLAEIRINLLFVRLDVHFLAAARPIPIIYLFLQGLAPRSVVHLGFDFSECGKRYSK